MALCLPTPIALFSVLFDSMHFPIHAYSLSSATVYRIDSKTETPPYPCQLHQWMVIPVSPPHLKILFRPFGNWTGARKLGTLVFYVTRKRNQQPEATSVQNTLCNKMSSAESPVSRNLVNAEHFMQQHFCSWQHIGQKPCKCRNTLYERVSALENATAVSVVLSNKVNFQFSPVGSNVRLFLHIRPGILAAGCIFTYVKVH
jgi:hypothetical protein